MINILIASIVLIALIIGSITDIKTREVPDWLNFSLVPLGLGIRLIYSISKDDYSFITAGIIGFVVFFLVALIMFYTGQWGGGDSKMLIGLGALIGLEFNFNTTFVSFLINTVIIGAIYGLIWGISNCLKCRKKFIKELKKILNSIIKIRKLMSILFIILILGLIFIPDLFIKLVIASLIIVIYTSFYLLIFVKAVEKSCMLKYVKPTEVTEGDWIAKDIIIDKKRIAGPKDLGIDKKQMKQLVSLYKKGKLKKVLIKVGIPFVPSFLIAYILTLLFGNILMYLV